MRLVARAISPCTSDSDSSSAFAVAMLSVVLSASRNAVTAHDAIQFDDLPAIVAHCLTASDAGAFRRTPAISCNVFFMQHRVLKVAARDSSKKCNLVLVLQSK